MLELHIRHFVMLGHVSADQFELQLIWLPFASVNAFFKLFGMSLPLQLIWTEFELVGSFLSIIVLHENKAVGLA